MSKLEYIEFTVGDNGEITTEAHGYTGKNCVKATAPIEARLGETTDREFKKEYRQSVTAQSRNVARNGD